MRLHTAFLLIALSVTSITCGCTPQQALIASLIPDGTLSALLGNLERVPDENRRRVAELERRGAWAELGQLAERELAKVRSNADWWLIAGYAHSQLADHAAAVEAYSQVVRIEPDNAAGWHLLAQTHRTAGAPYRAVNVLNNALLALRDSALTHYLLGETYSDLKRYREAAAAFEGALEIEQKFPAAWYALSMAYMRVNRDADARAAAAQLESLDPKLAARLREALAQAAVTTR